MITQNVVDGFVWNCGYIDMVGLGGNDSILGEIGSLPAVRMVIEVSTSTDYTEKFGHCLRLVHPNHPLEWAMATVNEVKL